MHKTVAVLPALAPETGLYARQSTPKGGRRGSRPSGASWAHPLIVTGGTVAITVVGGFLALGLVRNVIVETLRLVVG